MAQRLAHAFQAPERPHRRQHVRRVGALPAARLEPATCAGLVEHEIEGPPLSLPLHQPGTQLAQDGVVAARVGDLQAERILPIQPTPHRVRCLTIRPAFQVLQHRHQCEPPGRLGGLTPRREKVREIGVAVAGAAHIAQLMGTAAWARRRAGRQRGQCG